jgi:filamentous hemagglutinin
MRLRYIQSNGLDFLRGQGRREKVRSDGDVVRYNPNTDEFGVGSSGGSICTYYKPDPAVHGKRSNLEYFDDH